MERRGFLKLFGVSALPLSGRNSSLQSPEEKIIPGDPSVLKISDIKLIEVSSRADGNRRGIYVEILTNKGLTGIHGPIFNEMAFIIHSKFKSLLIGKDAIAGEDLWEKMRRRDRHARSGHMMMAISALDNALWDLRGKYFGVPVDRLLGGPTRDRLRAYGSMGGHSTEPKEAAEIAGKYYDQGFTAQKWFFDHSPKDGMKGMRKNIDMVHQLRDTLGDGAELLFDARWAWDVPYAMDMARAMLPHRPTWLEEPLHPEQLNGYIRLKRDTGIPLAAGEHLYTRWNIKPFLDASALDYVQADPEWCGGITELVKICALCAAYEVKVVPHGHGLLTILHVVASQSSTLCPLVEFLIKWQYERQQYFHKPVLFPENGYFHLPSEPGTGLALDEDKIEEKRELLFN
jgi:L-alanine-DL-glutamate epimerase-like enolase superfamily enzyme